MLQTEGRVYPYVWTCSNLVCGTGFPNLAREPPATCNRDSSSCFRERCSRCPLWSFRGKFEKGYGPHWYWGQMHQLVLAEMQEQHNMSSVMTDQCFRVWVTLTPMPNTLCHWDPNDFGFSEDCQEWAYIMPPKVGEPERKWKARACHIKAPSGNKPRVSERGVHEHVPADQMWGTCPRQCWRMRYGLCGIWWSTASCPRWWGCIASIWTKNSERLATIHRTVRRRIPRKWLLSCLKNLASTKH